MNYATIAPLVLDGWFLLHQFFRLPTSADADNGAEQFQALQDLLASWENLGDDGWSGAYRIVGGGTDLLLVHFRRSLEALGEVEKRLQRHPGGSDLELTADYLSAVELSLYHLTATLAAQAEEQGVEPGSEEWRSMVEGQLSEELTKPHVQQRLHPAQPDELPYVCVYPMDKRRNEGQNWYRVPLEERAAMMRDHGVTGRRYAGRISQVISGSMGLGRLGVGGHPLRSLAQRLQGDRCRDAFRRGERGIRRVRKLLGRVPRAHGQDQGRVVRPGWCGAPSGTLRRWLAR